MGKDRMSRQAFNSTRQRATAGGTQSVTAQAERTYRTMKEINPLVDPKGLSHLGPVRPSRPRFDWIEELGLWQLTIGMPITEETLLDTTGSMQNNVQIAFDRLPLSYDMYTEGESPVLSSYDVQIANATFGDVDDIHDCGYSDIQPIQPLLRSQFEMAGKIAEQLTMMIPSKNGCGNGKEDPQFGIFAAAFLGNARLNAYGLRGYHFTVSDEPVVERIDASWLTRLFGDDVFNAVTGNGHQMTASSVPDLATTVQHLQGHKHAFFLHVTGWSDYRHGLTSEDVARQWSRLYGPSHYIALPDGCNSLHLVKAVIIGLTEGVLSLSTAEDWLVSHGANRRLAAQIVKAVSHIPIGAQMEAENFGKLPPAGSYFRNKEDLWPISDEELAEIQGQTGADEDEEEGEVAWQL